MDTSIIEHAWRTSFQVVVYKGNSIQDDSIISLGSGFYLSYNSNVYFITADHVLHYDDYIEGKRLNQDYHVAIVTNIADKEKYESIYVPISGFYCIDRFDSQCPELPDFIDITFAKASDKITCPYLTDQLLDDDYNEVIKAGLEKFIIPASNISDCCNGKLYIVTGWCLQEISTMKVKRKNAIWCDLELQGQNTDGDIILKSPVSVELSEWKSLSGSPVFDYSKKLIGMLIEVNKNDDTLTIIPIHKILKFIDLCSKVETSI